MVVLLLLESRSVDSCLSWLEEKKQSGFITSYVTSPWVDEHRPRGRVLTGIIPCQGH